MSKLPKRICIIGPSSGGKSTLAQKLGRQTGFPVLHLDKIAHVPGTNWQRCPLEETIQKHDRFIQNECWIVEGNYRKFMPQRFERADMVIVHHFNRFGCAYRFIRRSFKKNFDRPGMLDGARDNLNLKMIRYILFKGLKTMKIYLELLKKYSHLDIVHIYSFKDIERLTGKLKYVDK